MTLPEKLTRWGFLRAAAGAAAAAGLLPRAARAATEAPAAELVSVASGKPFAGDRRMLATVSPGSWSRKAAILRFRLDRAAHVHVAAVRKSRNAERVVWETRAKLPRGPHRFRWQPAPTIAPGTYVLRMTLERNGRRRVYGHKRPFVAARSRAAVVRVLGVEAAFVVRAYAPATAARLRVAVDAASFTVQFFRAGPEQENTDRPDELKGVPVSDPVTVDWDKHRDAPATVWLKLGDWPTGLYFAKLVTNDGRTGFAPVIVRPPATSTSRVAVVLPTNTWQAYNFADADGDGWGDTWYAGGSPPVVLDRPYLQRGVPPYYRRYDLPFLRWLHATGKTPDYLAEEAVEAFGTGDALAARYDLVVYPGHTEYVTQREFDVVERYRDLGGNLIFLSANNFFWKVERRGRELRRVKLWRELGRPEARLLGTQYRANDNGRRQGSFAVQGYDAAPWAFAGTGLRNGSLLGVEVGGYGIEIDATTPNSPSEVTQVLATIPDLFGPGLSAEMTYYEHASGAKVFSAGVLDFGGSISWCPPARRLVENVWRHLAQP
ncbi:MAG TPA: N,N-dimethylformamidase beta subunit family domain-containing protein [Gaiellaceae bacterium]|nr:N,N-dimethylformamidase beta subunit family domain-containing protein [Gaiellaceae bacterium]